MLKAASAEFALSARVSAPFIEYGFRVEKVVEPLQTTVTYLESGRTRVVLVTPHIITHTFAFHRAICRTVSRAAGVPQNRVVVMSSHNHCSMALTREPQRAFWGEGSRRGPVELTAAGKTFLRKLERACTGLSGRAVPVTIAWAVGRERRIQYNRKGRRADGSTYFMREEDRRALGRDFTGDVDDEAPVVVLHDAHGRVVTAILQFNAHPATAYHPEHGAVFGEYPQVAAGLVAEHLAVDDRPARTAFLQGCAGDINSKGLLSGDIDRARRHGRWLGQACIKALRTLTASQRRDMGFARVVARVPLRPLPSPARLRRDLEEMEAFAARARAGDENTLHCVGLNFPPQLSPPFRAGLVDPVQRWCRRALALHQSDRADESPRHLPMEACILRLGDVAIVGMPCEPFVGIGRQVRRDCVAPLTIPCGYTNISFGYVPDGPNCNDPDYMSSFYRYTRQRTDFQRPGGDVLAHTAADAANRLL